MKNSADHVGCYPPWPLASVDPRSAEFFISYMKARFTDNLLLHNIYVLKDISKFLFNT